MNSTKHRLEVKAWPDIFRPIGPDDHMVVSAEKLTEYIASEVKEARIDELERLKAARKRKRYYGKDMWKFFDYLEKQLKKLQESRKSDGMV